MKMNASTSSKEQKKTKKCEICDKPSEEIFLILKSFKKRLSSKILNQNEEFQEIKSDKKKSSVSLLPQALELITGAHKNSENSSCEHKELFGYEIVKCRKVRCSFSTLNQNVEEIIYEVAHKNYQLETLVQQVQATFTEISTISETVYDFSITQNRKLRKPKHERKILAPALGESHNQPPPSENLIEEVRNQGSISQINNSYPEMYENLIYPLGTFFLFCPEWSDLN